MSSLSDFRTFSASIDGLDGLVVLVTAGDPDPMGMLGSAVGDVVVEAPMSLGNRVVRGVLSDAKPDFTFTSTGDAGLAIFRDGSAYSHLRRLAWNLLRDGSGFVVKMGSDRVIEWRIEEVK